MSSVPAHTLLAVLLGTLPTLAQTSMVPLNSDRRAAVVEVLPPESIQQSPAAADLVNRLIRKHMLLLQHPALITQVMQNPEIKKERWIADKDQNAVDKLVAAIRVRAIPDTNLIELIVDPAVAGEESVALAETIVNQHMENQKVLAQNVQLERSVILNNLKQRYQFRKDELGRDLREKAVQLSVDGMGMPGRISAREIELGELIKLKFELRRKKDQAQTPVETKAAETQLKEIEERLDAAKADLGALTNAMNQYLALKEDEQATRAALKQVNQQLEEISQGVNGSAGLELRWLCHPSR